MFAPLIPHRVGFVRMQSHEFRKSAHENEAQVFSQSSVWFSTCVFKGMHCDTAALPPSKKHNLNTPNPAAVTFSQQAGPQLSPPPFQKNQSSCEMEIILLGFSELLHISLFAFSVAVQ